MEGLLNTQVGLGKDISRSVPAAHAVDAQSQAKLQLLNEIGLGRPNNDDSAVIDLTRHSTSKERIEEIIDKLNELLAEHLPGGIESIQNQEFTPESAAEFVLDGVNALFEQYRLSRPNLSQDDLNRFFSAVKQGVERGYSSAHQSLKEIGALELDGVEATISRALKLIQERVSEFESDIRASYVPTTQKGEITPPVASASEPAEGLNLVV